MAKGDFARLRHWAEDEGHQLQVTQPGSTTDGSWHVSVDLIDPVELHATSSDSDIDLAAEQVILQLVTVGEILP
jgi:hypothetical protein